MALSSSLSRWKQYWPVAVLVSLAVAGVLTAFAAAYHADIVAEDARLDFQIDYRQRAIVEAFSNYEDMLRTVRVYLEGTAGNGSDGDFDAVISRVFAAHRGIKFFGFAPRVTAEERHAFETTARKAGRAGFAIMERSGDGRLVRAADRDVYFPLRNLVPSINHPALLGYDLGAADGAMLTRARDMDDIAASRPLALTASGSGVEEMLIAVPVYRAVALGDGTSDPNGVLIGFAVAGFDIGDLFEAILREATIPQGFDQYLFHGDRADPAQLVHVHNSVFHAAGVFAPVFTPALAEPHFTRHLTFAGQTWTVITRPQSGMYSVPPDIGDWLILTGGAIATFMIAIFAVRSIRQAASLTEAAGNLRQTAVRLSEEIEERKHTEERLAIASEIVENSPVVIARLRFLPGNMLPPKPEYFSENVAQFGYSAEELTSGAVDFFDDVIHPDDLKPALGSLAEAAIAGEGNAAADFRLRCRDGRVRWVEGRMSFQRDAAGFVCIGHGVLRDITERRQTSKKLEYSTTLLKTAMETSLDAILVVDGDNRISAFNRRFMEMWNVPEQLFHIGDDTPVLNMVASRMSDPAHFIDRVRYLYDHPQEMSDEELTTADGRTIARYSSALHSEAGAYLGRIWFFRDITARRRVEAQLLQIARSDGVTGLANRVAFAEAVERAIERARRSGVSFAVLYLDLDHFKDVNDTLGHPVGDALLTAFAERLRAAVRETDFVARFGGDEFAVLTGDIRDPTEVGMLATRILRMAKAPYSVHNNTLRIGASIGIATFGAEAANTEVLLSQADLALYRAKAQGRGAYRFFTEDMDAEVRSRVTLASELREAIEDGQLYLAYQPQIDIAGGEIVGAEALVRWRHPRRGELLPKDFIEVAEKSGLIIPLGYWVLREVCQQVKSWTAQGIAPKSTALNFSALQFKSPLELERTIDAIIGETGVMRSLLEFELTESAVMETSSQHSDLIDRIHRSGIKLAIDDFGTGFSSLDYLRRFPVDRLKLAQIFVAGVARGDGDAAIARAAIGLARELGIRVIAEGVETKAQLDLLRSWGCQQAQGYYFAKPLPVEQMTQLLRQRRRFETGQAGTDRAA